MTGDETRLRPTRGGFLRPFGLGEFIRAYLSGDDTYGACVSDPKRGAPTEDIRSSYKNALLREHAEDMVALAMEKGIELSVEEALRRIPHRLTKIRSHSFYRYFHHLKMLGWVEATGEEEGSLIGGSPGARVEKTSQGTTMVEVPQPRRFYCLTAKGKQAPIEGGGIRFRHCTTTLARSGARKRQRGSLPAPAACPAGRRPKLANERT
ncbi:hypothetical protein ES703_48824 [subsurface metagenome]